MNQSELNEIHINGLKRWKTRDGKSRFGLILLLIGWESGANLPKQNQSKREYNLNTV